MGMMGEAAMMTPTVVMKTSRLQMLQVYMFSAMFGYYLRRVDQRFQLAKSAGFIPEDPEDAVQRLERLFTLVRKLAPSIQTHAAHVFCMRSNR
jgi:hypothetical protein